MAGSLLARIAAAADPHSSERQTGREQDVEAAVLKNLSQMLATRQGSALTCPDYGVPELTEMLHDFPNAIGLMQRAIKNTIAAHEPRLSNVQVRHVKNEASHSMLLEFEITAQLQLPDGRRRALRVGTTVDQNGNVSVAG